MRQMTRRVIQIGLHFYVLVARLCGQIIACQLTSGVVVPLLRYNKHLVRLLPVVNK